MYCTSCCVTDKTNIALEFNKIILVRLSFFLHLFLQQFEELKGKVGCRTDPSA